ncbi:hypothetical protein BJX63DRAFT_34952 [Aspergillus granulosus]|uniref:Uncharacterized protein n=1 Tax=Aspergillus granulosus TaxID=176169 RepID=A0ABR4GZ79_9EURO
MVNIWPPELENQGPAKIRLEHHRKVSSQASATVCKLLALPHAHTYLPHLLTNETDFWPSKSTTRIKDGSTTTSSSDIVGFTISDKPPRNVFTFCIINILL